MHCHPSLTESLLLSNPEYSRAFKDHKVSLPLSNPKMASQDEFKELSAEEQEIIKSLRKKKAESSALKSQSISKGLSIAEPREEVEGSSSEKVPLEPIETIDVESLPTPTSLRQIGDEQPQSVAARIKKRSANALPIKMRTLEEEEEPRTMKAKKRSQENPAQGLHHPKALKDLEALMRDQ